MPFLLAAKSILMTMTTEKIPLRNNHGRNCVSVHPELINFHPKQHAYFCVPYLTTVTVKDSDESTFVVSKTTNYPPILRSH